MTHHLLRVTCILISLSAAVLAQSWRTAVIKDSAAVSTEMSRVWIESDFPVFPSETPAGNIDLINKIVVTTDTIDLAIPTSVLQSVTVDRGVAVVKYRWGCTEKSIRGTLASSKVTGDSDSGHVEVAAAKVASMLFKTPPVEMAVGSLNYDAAIILSDGSRMRTASLYRQEFRTRGRRNLYGDFRLRVGEILNTVAFNTLNRVDFNGAGTIAVAMKNGRRISAKLSDKDEERVDAFLGVSEQGAFLVRQAKVKALEFGVR